MSDSHEDFEPIYFSLEPSGKVVVVRVNKTRLSDEDNVEQFGFELMRIVDQLGYQRIVLSLAGVKWITSSILGKLIHLHRHLKRINGELVICDLDPTVREVLETSRLDTYFSIIPSVDQAVVQLQT